MSDDENGFAGSEFGERGIRGALERALALKKEYTPWCVSRNYPSAPSPRLPVGEPAKFSVPLCEDVVDGIRQAARVVSGTCGDNVWTVDASSLSLGESWDMFMTQVLGDVCEDFGIDSTQIRPECHLRKLTLSGPGSKTLPRSNAPPDDCTFATIQVILPARYTGGAIRLMHSPVTSVFETIPGEDSRCSVLAWFNGVIDETEPVTEGHRLSLSYDIVKTTRAPFPIPPSYTNVTSQLDRVFQDWKNSTWRDSPEKLFYLLDYRRPGKDGKDGGDANSSEDTDTIEDADPTEDASTSEDGTPSEEPKPVSAAILRGEDAITFALVHSVAAQHGLKVGFADLTLFDVGTHYVEDDEPFDASDPVPYESVEDEEQQFTVDAFVDIDGNPMPEEPMEGLEDIEECTIPRGVYEALRRGGYDDDEDEFCNDLVWCLKKWYIRTVLVIWEYRDELSWTYAGKKGFDKAIDELANVQSPCPTPEEAALAQWAAKQTRYHDLRASEKIYALAILWEDAGLCKAALGELPLEAKFQALEIFGFDAVSPSLQRDIKNSFGLAERFELIRAIELQLNERKPHAQCYGRDWGFVQDWLYNQVAEAVKGSHTATPVDCANLLAMAYDAGGVSFIAQRIVERMTSWAAESLLEFTRALHADDTRFSPSEEKKTLVSRLMAVAVSRAVDTRHYPYLYARDDNSVWHLLPFIDTCFSTQSESALVPITDHLIDKASRGPSSDTRAAAAQDIIAFVAYRLGRTGGKSFPGVQRLQEVGLPPYLDMICPPTRMQLSTSRLDARAASTLVRAAVVDNRPDVLMTTVVPALEAAELIPSDLKAFADELHSQRGHLVFPPDYSGRTLHSAVSTFSRAYVGSVELDSSESIVDTLEWLVQLEQAELTDQLLARLTENPTADYLSGTLLPSLPRLHAWGVLHGRVAALRTTFQTILPEWRRQVLGDEPKTTAAFNAALAGLARWTCACDGCLRARAFVAESTERVVELERIGAEACRHVQQAVREHAPLLALCRTVRGAPQGVQIRKSEMMFQVARWRAEKLQGHAIWGRLGSDEERRFLLGGEYDAVRDALGEPPARLVVPAAAQPVSSSHSFQMVTFSPAASVPASQGRKGRPSKKRRVA